MPRRDPLFALARLRKFETDQARLAFVGTEASRAAAAERVARAEAALDAEMAALPADYAAWLPAGQAARARAGDGSRKAEAATEVARATLAAAGAEAEALEALLRARRDAIRRARRAAEQRVIDDAAGTAAGRRGPPPGRV
jgi:hypothetical protein